MAQPVRQEWVSRGVMGDSREEAISRGRRLYRVKRCWEVEVWHRKMTMDRGHMAMVLAEYISES